jgi:carbamoyltransferase
MKLLSLRLCDHDSNISYFDGQNVHYYKSEREYQIKHHHFDNLWEWRDVIKRIWDVDYKEIDEISIIFEPWRYRFPNVPKHFFPAYEYDLFPAPCKVWRLDHHYAHALSNWMMMDNEPDVNIVIDGSGDAGTDVTWTVFNGDQIIERGDQSKCDSIGRSMNKLGLYLGIDPDTHGLDYAGKVMSLQSYGKLDYEFLNKLSHYNMYNIDGMFNEAIWLEHKNDNRLGHLFGIDFARTIHQRTGEILVDFFKQHANKDDVIFYSGGVAQNIVWNTELRKNFPNIIIPPHSADDGLSLGGLEWLRRKHNLPKFKLDNFPYVQSDVSVEEPTDATIDAAAQFLADGKIIEWYQGHGEVGPRALGNRSILMNPTIPNGRDKINSIKKRENFRPFGASVLEEHASTYFNTDGPDPYMLYVAEVKPEYQDRLNSITHIDGTCRIQTVSDNNPVFRKLLERFNALTGYPILLNTSLNVNRSPIANSPVDAQMLFNQSNIDCLIVGNNITQK